MTAFGSPLGHVIYGQVVYDSAGLIVCGECGKAWSHLATHIRYAHGMSAAQYREKYGLGRSTKLVSEDSRQKMRDKAADRRPEILERLAKHRQPEKAAEASRGLPWAPETRAKRQAVGRASRSPDLTPEQAARLGDGVDLQVWADAARALRAEGVSIAALARAADITATSVSQRLRKYPER